MTSTSNDKLLDVLELIITQKAVSPMEIQKQTGLSRTAVHRALKSLESRNIARARLGNGQYTLSSEFA